MDNLLSTAKEVLSIIPTATGKDNEINTLSGLLKVINNYISNNKEKEEYFNQYSHCIIYLFGKINNQEEIIWKTTDSIEQTSLVSLSEDGRIKEIVTKKDLDACQIPGILLRIFKAEIFENTREKATEKNPILTK